MIREAHTFDREQILKLAYAMWQEAEGWVPADFSKKADINAVTQYVDSIFASKSKVFLVWHDQDVIRGCVVTGIEDGFGTISDLYVEPSARKKGIGTKLILECEKRIQASGCEFIDIQVAVLNSAAAVYERMGYRDIVRQLRKRAQPTSPGDVANRAASEK